MTVSHLSDEAVAACADGVLSGHARERALRHIKSCAECRQAVQGQREAALALRTARAPQASGALLDRLRDVPQTTPITTLPTAIGPDGSTVLSTFAPMAGLVPEQPRSRRARPYITTAAVVALAGALAAGSVAVHDSATAGAGHVVRHPVPFTGQIGQQAPVGPIAYFRTQP
ncbi:MAG TPA: zf-HC2 domain-containing protein [Jatrophihabitans sp.]|nr:zf-HC2 domain-containing protein [Jatrophihabitans sp.]